MLFLFFFFFPTFLSPSERHQEKTKFSKVLDGSKDKSLWKSSSMHTGQLLPLWKNLSPQNSGEVGGSSHFSVIFFLFLLKKGGPNFVHDVPW